MPDGKRLWRTDDGSLVEDGHPAARLLAYGVDDELEGDDVKAVSKPANKQVKKPANK
jgi:hypothetical protein